MTIFFKGKKKTLSRREAEVARYVAMGKTNSEIATILGLSLHTVRNHVEAMRVFYGAPTKVAAVYSALMAGDLVLPGKGK